MNESEEKIANKVGTKVDGVDRWEGRFFRSIYLSSSRSPGDSNR